MELPRTSPPTLASNSDLPQVLAYPRGRNRFGIRNHILVVPTTFCTNRLAEEIADAFRDVRFGPQGENRVIALYHGVGCCSVGFDEELGLRVLKHATRNPNVGAVLSVSLGCGAYCSSCHASGASKWDGKLIQRIQESRQQYEVVTQGHGTRGALQQAKTIIGRLVDELGRQERTPHPISKLVVGVMNGSSDSTSGLFTNPAVGYFGDWLIDQGGRVLFSQTIETLGAESFLLERVKSDSVRQRLKRLLTAVTMLRRGVEKEGIESDPTRGNRLGGLSTLAEKSIGTVFKIGHDPSHEILGVIEHGGTLDNHQAGLYLIDGPGQDLICATGLAVAGAHLIIFTTGRGTPTGSAISPTLKVTSNRQTFTNQQGDIDVYFPVEEIFDSGRGLKDIALETLTPRILSLVEGRELATAEVRGQRDFAVRQLWPID